MRKTYRINSSQSSAPRFQMIKKVLIGLTLMVVTSTSWALTLTDAKSTGLVKESGKGYLQVVKQDDKDVAALVKDINGKRKAKYSEIAKRNKISLRAVEKQAAKRL